MAAKLILSLNGTIIKEYPLDKERVTIGRKASNDIAIDNLAVSGEHAAIVTILNDSFLEDLGSTNGVEVNGAPTKKHFLQNNDLIEIGKYKLKYVHELFAQAGADDLEKTMVLRPGIKPATPDTAKPGETAGLLKASNVSTSSPGAEDVEITGKFDMRRPVEPVKVAPPPRVSAAAPTAVPTVTATINPAVNSRPSAVSSREPAAPSAQAVNQTSAVVQILSGPNAGKDFELVKSLTTLGKPGVQVAVLTRRPHGFFITHVEGERFPLVNGQVLDSHAHQLDDHDVIELAGVKMEFYFKE